MVGLKTNSPRFSFSHIFPSDFLCKGGRRTGWGPSLLYMGEDYLEDGILEVDANPDKNGVYSCLSLVISEKQRWCKDKDTFFSR